MGIGETLYGTADDFFEGMRLGFSPPKTGKAWERDLPVGMADTLGKYKNKPSSQALRDLRREERAGVVTSLAEIRNLAKLYSRRFKVPVRISESAFKDNPHADALHVLKGGRSTIYLHPILVYYPESYIRGAIEHELDHMNVERKWEGIL